MKNKFVGNLVFLLLLNLLIKPFYILGIDAGVQNAVGSVEYGLFFSLFNLTFLLNIFSDLGITNYNNRNIAQNTHLLNNYFPRILSIRVMLITLFFAVVIISGFFLGYDQRTFKLLLWITLNQALASLILFLRSNLAGMHLFKQDSIISVLDRFLLIVFCGYALWFWDGSDSFSIELFIGLQTFCYSIAAITAFVMVYRHLDSFKFKFNRAFSLSIIKESLPYALMTLLMGIYHRMDSVMLERMLDNGDVASGIYAQGYRFLDALNNFSFLFAVLLFPIFARMLKEKIDLNPVVNVGNKLLLTGILLISITAFFFKTEIMSWRYVEHIASASSTFGVLIISAFFYGLIIIYGSLLTADGRLKWLNYIAVGGVLINLVLNLILIPKQQEYGSALATLVTQGTIAIANTYLAIKVFKIKITPSFLIKLLLLTLILLAFGKYQVEFNINWPYRMAIMLSIGALYAIAVRLIDIREFLALLKQRA